MTNLDKNLIGTAALAGGLATLSAAGQTEPPTKRVEELISNLGSTNDVTSVTAVESAPEYGPRAVRPLAFTMSSANLEISRRAKRALLRVVRHAGRPGGGEEAAAVEAKLKPLLEKKQLSLQTRRDLVWMLSEIGTARAVEAIVALLQDKDLREDARCALTRLPCPEAVTALKAAFEKADEDFKFALAESLRIRGQQVEGCPTKKLTPTRG